MRERAEACPMEESMSDKTDKAMDRRNFLRAVGGASTVAVAAVASPIAAPEAQAYDPGNDETRARYRESDHVKAYYRTNGYESLKK
jgi:secreted PhoX family phosphatase